MEEEDGEGKFREDAWCRPGGGGGVSRVMQVPPYAIFSTGRQAEADMARMAMQK